MSKLYVKSPDGTSHNLDIKTDAFMVGGQAATNYQVHYIVTHSGFLIYKKDYLRTNVEMTLPFPVWEAGVLATLYDPPSNAADYTYYVTMKSVTGTSKKPIGSYTIKLANGAQSSTTFLTLVVGEIALDF